MKNTAPPRALRGQGLTGAAPPIDTDRGGCGRHEPPQKDFSGRAIGSGGRGANPWQRHRGETPCTRTRELKAEADKKGSEQSELLPLCPNGAGSRAPTSVGEGEPCGMGDEPERPSWRVGERPTPKGGKTRT